MEHELARCSGSQKDIEDVLRLACWWIMSARFYPICPGSVGIRLRLRWFSFLGLGLVRIWAVVKARPFAERAKAAGITIVLR